MLAVVEEDVESDGFAYGLIDLGLDVVVEVPRRMLVIEAVAHLILLPHDIQRVQPH